MEEVVWVEGPVMKIGGDLVVLVTVNDDVPFSECLKIVISDDLARMSQIEVGDLICLKNTEGRFKLQSVKSRSMS